MSLLKTLAVVGGIASTVAAHGHVTGLVVDGVYYEGYNPSFQFETNPPAVIGWTCAECLDNGFVAPDAYADPNIICHKNATPGGTHATVKAGGTIEVQWTAWPSSHHGPVIDYLAKCDGACETVDKTALEFFKIDAGGLVDDSVVPGTWASDQLIANNNSWVLRIPSDLAPGNYVLRHEIIALHSAGNADGAQNYPQCFNLEVTGSGSDAPTGTLGTALYKESDPGILINIYTSLSTYDIPGPTLISGALSASQTPVAATGAATVSSVAAVTSSPAAVVPPSSSSSAAASSSSDPPAVTPTSSAAPTSPSSSASPSATPTPIPVAVLSSAVASASASDPTFSSALPTVLSTGAATSSGASTKPLPAGVTLADVLAWLEALLGPVLKTDGKRVDRVKVVEAEQRKHARQFG